MRIPLVDAEAPPERLAAFRVLAGGFTLLYLLIRLPVFLELAGRSPDRFDPVGVFLGAQGPWPAWAFRTVLVLTLLIGGGFVAGWRYRITGPGFALGVLVLTSYRSSWGQLLHFEHLFTLHVLILAFSPAADRWSLDARRTAHPPRQPTAYGFPLRLAAVVVVSTYVIAGIAKLRYGGWDWVAGDTLRNHIAYSAARLDLLGGTPSPLARPAVVAAWLLPPIAAASVAIELAAPVALVGGRWRTGWVLAVWSMHAGIVALMFVGFPYPLFLVAFAPFFDLEHGVRSTMAFAQNVGRS